MLACRGPLMQLKKGEKGKPSPKAFIKYRIGLKREKHSGKYKSSYQLPLAKW